MFTNFPPITRQIAHTLLLSYLTGKLFICYHYVYIFIKKRQFVSFCYLFVYICKIILLIKENNDSWSRRSTPPTQAQTGLCHRTLPAIWLLGLPITSNQSNPAYNGKYADNLNRPPYNPFLYFMVDENAEEQKDLLVATQTARPIDNKVHFHFTHPCAALQFAICKTKALTNFSIQVESVILHNIYSSGFYYFDTDSWEVDTEEQPSYFTLLEYPSNSQGMRVNTEVSSTDRTNSTFLGNGDDDYLFFIPQTITGWSGGSVANTDGAYIEIRCSITKGNKNYAEDGAVYIPFSAVLEKGFIHRFNIRMGTSLRNAEGLTINFRDQ